jgi:hypothetical protein
MRLSHWVLKEHFSPGFFVPGVVQAGYLPVSRSSHDMAAMAGKHASTDSMVRVEPGENT